MSGREITQQNGMLQSVIVSGSKNGEIKAWAIPTASQFSDAFGPNKE